MGVLRGGPWCGAEIPAPADARWLWIDGSPERINRPRVFREPGAGRLLYRRQDPRAACLGYDFAGYLFTDCPDCGLVHALYDPRGRELKECSLCGANLSQPRV